MAELKVCWKDNEHCEKVILDGEEVEVKESRYGGNDFVIEFLIRSGLMKTMERMYPNYLKQDNGKSWIALNRVQIIRELMKVGRIAKVGKVIHDSSLIAVCGFNLEEIEKKAKEEEKNIEEPVQQILKTEPKPQRKSIIEKWSDKLKDFLDNAE